MIIAIDYDDTYTRDPVLWNWFNDEIEWWWEGNFLSLDDYLAVNTALSDEKKVMLKLKYG